MRAVFGEGLTAEQCCRWKFAYETVLAAMGGKAFSDVVFSEFDPLLFLSVTYTSYVFPGSTFVAFLNTVVNPFPCP